MLCDSRDVTIHHGMGRVVVSSSMPPSMQPCPRRCNTQQQPPCLHDTIHHCLHSAGCLRCHTTGHHMLTCSTCRSAQASAASTPAHITRPAAVSCPHRHHCVRLACNLYNVHAVSMMCAHKTGGGAAQVAHQAHRVHHLPLSGLWLWPV